MSKFFVQRSCCLQQILKIKRGRFVLSFSLSSSSLSSKRYFFSFLTKTNSNNDNDVPKYSKDFGNTDNFDESKYRRPITISIWNEFRHERQRIRNFLSSSVPNTNKWEQQCLNKNDYRKICSEIQHEVNNIWNSDSTSDPPSLPSLSLAEYGPSGNWVYRFEVIKTGRDGDGDVNDRRVYQRYPSESVTFSSSSLLSPQLVLELEPYEEIVSMSITPDETCVAYIIRNDKRSSTQVFIRNIASGKELILSSTELYSSFSLECGPSLSLSDYYQSLYVVLANEQGRPDRVVACTFPSLLLTTENHKPAATTTTTLIYKNDDPQVFVDIQRTKGCQYVIINALSKSSNEIFLCSDPRHTKERSPLVLVKPRQTGILYHVDVGIHQDLVMLTSDENSNDGNFILKETSIDSLPLSGYNADVKDDEKNNGADKMEGDSFFIEDMDLFQRYIVLYERSKKNGDQRLRVRNRRRIDSDDTIIDLVSLSTQIISTAEIDTRNTSIPLWSKLTPVGNMFFNANCFRFQLESPANPGVVYEYNFDEKIISSLSPIQEGGSGSDSADCNEMLVKKRIIVESADGTGVPLSIFYNKNKTKLPVPLSPSFSVDDSIRTKSKKQTIVLSGYGSYGEPIDLGHNPGWQHLLDRGVVLAFAHTRGGGDLGKSFYASGRKENKIRSIEDFEACAKFLKYEYATFGSCVDRHSTSSSSSSSVLVAKAFSAGGILVGAVVNRCPDLFDKVVLTNAFLDVFSTMKSPHLFLTEHEYDEFGNPTVDPNIDAIIRSYCPIRNLKPNLQSSTKFLVIGTLDDPNVPYWNSTIYFKKLTTMRRNDIDGKVNQDKDNGNRTEIYQRAFLELQKEGGHNFSSEHVIEVLALENSFILQ